MNTTVQEASISLGRGESLESFANRLTIILLASQHGMEPLGGEVPGLEIEFNGDPYWTTLNTFVGASSYLLTLVFQLKDRSDNTQKFFVVSIDDTEMTWSFTQKVWIAELSDDEDADAISFFGDIITF